MYVVFVMYLSKICGWLSGCRSIRKVWPQVQSMLVQSIYVGVTIMVQEVHVPPAPFKLWVVCDGLINFNCELWPLFILRMHVLHCCSNYPYELCKKNEFDLELNRETRQVVHFDGWQQGQVCAKVLPGWPLIHVVVKGHFRPCILLLVVHYPSICK